MKRMIQLIALCVALSLLLVNCAPASPTAAPLPTQAPPPPTVQVVPTSAPVAPTAVPTVAPTKAPAPTVAPTSPPPPTAVPQSKAQPLDKARITTPSKLVNLDPVKAAVVPDIMTQYLVYGRLYRLNLDWSIYPELAAGMPQVSADGLTVKVTLQKGLQYSDGSPITAADAVYAFERQRDLKGVLAFLLPPIKSAEATDDVTIVFHLNNPYLNLTFVTASMAMPLNPKAKVQADPDYFQHPVFSGQYVIKSWVPGANDWVLQDNPKYAGGLSMVHELTVEAVPDQNSRVLQLTSGQAQFAIDLPPGISKQGLPAEVKIETYPTFGGYNLSFNLGLPDTNPLKNKDVRHAISLAIDRQQLADKAFFGTVKPLAGYLPAGIPDGLNVFPNGGKRDVEGAKKLLASTPFAKGFKVELQVWNRPSWPDAALVVQQNLADIGIDAQVSVLEDAVGIANLNAGKYEMLFASNVQEPLTLLQNEFLSTGAWGAWTKYNNPQVDKLLNDASTAVDQKQRFSLEQQAQQIGFDDMPNTALTERVTVNGNRLPGIINAANTPPGVYPTIQLIKDVK